MAPRLAFARSWASLYAVFMDYSPIILKNRGIPCKFAKTVKSGDYWERVLDEEGNVETETLNIKFNNNSISDIEMHFGGLESWQDSLEKFPITTLRQTIAYVLRRSPEEVGEAMLDGEVVMYSNIIGTAWSIANGVDPITASKMLQQSVGLAEEAKKALNEQLTKAMEQLQPTGTSGSDSGPKRATRSKNSGN